MQKRTLIICRGLPGSGKSSLARSLAPGSNYAADDFFTKGGRYDFDFTRIGEAHAWCMGQVEEALARHDPLVAVHNTFSRDWEARAYYSLAANYGYTIFVVEAQNDFGNTHEVPESAIQVMRDRWEPLRQPLQPLWRIIRHRLTLLFRGHH